MILPEYLTNEDPPEMKLLKFTADMVATAAEDVAKQCDSHEWKIFARALREMHKGTRSIRATEP